MSPRVAVELSAHLLRAVVAPWWSRTPRRRVEVPWDPDAPERGVAALREAVGAADSLALAVGLAFLEVKRVALPPADDTTRERMLALESERYFAAGRNAVVALAPGGSVAVATDGDRLARWLNAFKGWAPVVRVEASPVALVRSLGANTSGDFQVEAGPGEAGRVTIARGQLSTVRRVPVSAEESAGRALPARRGTPGDYLAAWGALLGEDLPPGATLAPADLRAAFAARRRRRLLVATAAAVAGVSVAVMGADRWRARTLEALAAEVASLRAAAAPGQAALAAAAQLDAETARVTQGAPRRGTALGALAALSSALPRDAVVLNLHAIGDTWQVDGTADDAAALVPLLDRDGRFDNVRILSASTRFQDGRRTRETFSLSLRVRPGA